MWSGGRVTFAWERKTAGLPQGALSAVRVRIRSEGGGGADVQWVEWPDGGEERDVLRADFAGLNLPSMHVRGLPGPGGRPPGMGASIPSVPTEAVRPAPGGPLFRPTLVTLSGAPAPWPARPWPAPARGAGAVSAAREWALSYHAGSLPASVSAPSGAAAAFAYREVLAPHPDGDAYGAPVPGGGSAACARFPVRLMGLASAAEAAPGLPPMRREWSWDGPCAVTEPGSFDGVETAERTECAPGPPGAAGDPGREAAALRYSEGVWLRREGTEGGEALFAVENLAVGEAGVAGGADGAAGAAGADAAPP